MLRQATDEGVLESQIAQSPYLTQDEKRWSLTQQNISLGSRLKLAQARSILVRLKRFLHKNKLFHVDDYFHSDFRHFNQWS
jgi:hypothetical protein